MSKKRDSGIEWIGEIPEHWNLERLQWHISEIKELNKPEKSRQVLSLTNKRGVIPYEEKGAQGNVAKEDYSQYKLAYPGTIVANSMNILIGSVGRCDYFGCVSPVYYVYKPNDGENLEFINYMFQMEQFQRNLRRYANGILEIRLRVSSDGILKQELAFPPSDEQTRIVAFLDQKCDQVDSLIANVQAQIEKLRSYKQSVITEVVTKGLNSAIPMKNSGVEWLGNVPSHWGVYRIANLYTERSESGLPELPILTVSINTGVSDHEVADKDKDRVFIRMEDRSKYKRVCPGDLTYNMMRAWQGAFGAVRVDGLVSPAYVVAKPKNDIPLDSRYIEALLRTPVAIEEMHRYSRGIVDFRLRLYWPEFKNICICLPPIDEQRKIADYIDEIAAKVDALVAIKQAKIEKLEQYKRSLIYEYVTGKREVS